MATVEASVLAVVRSVVSAWRGRELSIRPLLGGLSNQLFRVDLNDATPDDDVVRVVARVVAASVSDEALDARPEDALHRPQGAFVDRDMEAKVQALAADAGFAPRVLGSGLLPRPRSLSPSPSSQRTPPKGLPGAQPAAGAGSAVASALAADTVRVEEWVPSSPITASDMLLPGVYTTICQTLARFHALPVPRVSSAPTVVPVLERLLHAGSHLTRLSFAAGTPASKRAASLFGGVDMDAEVAFVLGAARRVGTPVVLVHGDSQPGNWLGATPSNSGPTPVTCRCARRDAAPAASRAADSPVPLRLIDYEFAGPNFRGFEFGNMFCELLFDYSHATHPFFCFDKARYPSEELKTAMLTCYAEHLPSPVPVSQLRMEAEVGILASHLQWAVWSMCQVAGPLAHMFGYLQYGQVRLSEYLRLKPHLQRMLTDFTADGP